LRVGAEPAHYLLLSRSIAHPLEHIHQSCDGAAAWAVVLVNALWALDSVVLLVAGWVAPNLLGFGFVLAQAAVVAGFAALQVTGLRGTAEAA
jgi:hypothetical protein